MISNDFVKFMGKTKLIMAQTCLSCKSHKIKLFHKQDKWTVYKCLNCGYIFTNPYPAPEVIHEYYTFDYFKDERHVKKFFNSNGTLKIGEVDYLSRIVDIENEFDQRGRLLEIGAAHGQFLDVMKRIGWEVNGVEISSDACKIAHDEYGLEIFNGTFLEYSDDKLFNVICMYQTLEHVYQPFEHIEKAYSLLKTGGILVIEVPNVYSFDMLVSKKRRWYSYDLPRHLSHFYPRILKKHLLTNNFTIVKIDRYYSNFILTLNNLKKKKSESDGINCNVYASSSQDENMPKMKKAHVTWKGELLKKLSYLLPGWKFTIIARK